MFIIALTSVRHLSLSWASPIQSIYPHPTSWRSILILSTHLRLGLPGGLLPSGFPIKTLYTPSPHPYAPHAQSISLFSILSPAQYWVSSTNHLAPRYAISSIPPLRRHSSVRIFSSTPCSQTPSASFPPAACVILIAFPMQQWLHERVAVLHYIYIACIVIDLRPNSDYFPIHH